MSLSPSQQKRAEEAKKQIDAGNKERQRTELANQPVSSPTLEAGLAKAKAINESGVVEYSYYDDQGNFRHPTQEEALFESEQLGIRAANNRLEPPTHEQITGRTYSQTTRPTNLTEPSKPPQFFESPIGTVKVASSSFAIKKQIQERRFNRSQRLDDITQIENEIKSLQERKSEVQRLPDVIESSWYTGAGSRGKGPRYISNPAKFGALESISKTIQELENKKTAKQNEITGIDFQIGKLSEFQKQTEQTEIFATTQNVAQVEATGTSKTFGARGRNVFQEAGKNAKPIEVPDALADVGAGILSGAKNTGIVLGAMPEGFARDIKAGKFGEGQKYFETEVQPKLEPTLATKLLEGKYSEIGGKNLYKDIGSGLFDAAIIAVPLGVGKGAGAAKNAMQFSKTKSIAETIAKDVIPEGTPYKVSKGATPSQANIDVGVAGKSPVAKILVDVAEGKAGFVVKQPKLSTPNKVTVTGALGKEAERLGFKPVGESSTVFEGKATGTTLDTLTELGKQSSVRQTAEILNFDIADVAGKPRLFKGLFKDPQAQTKSISEIGLPVEREALVTTETFGLQKSTSTFNFLLRKSGLNPDNIDKIGGTIKTPFFKTFGKVSTDSEKIGAGAGGKAKRLYDIDDKILEEQFKEISKAQKTQGYKEDFLGTIIPIEDKTKFGVGDILEQTIAYPPDTKSPREKLETRTDELFNIKSITDLTTNSKSKLNSLLGNLLLGKQTTVQKSKVIQEEKLFRDILELPDTATKPKTKQDSALDIITTTKTTTILPPALVPPTEIPPIEPPTKRPPRTPQILFDDFFTDDYFTGKKKKRKTTLITTNVNPNALLSFFETNQDILYGKKGRAKIEKLTKKDAARRARSKNIFERIGI